MKFYAYAEITSTLPDDQVEDGGKIIRLGGLNVAEAIAELLRSSGYEVEPPEFMGDHGWDLNLYVNGRRIWLELQGGPEEFVLQVEAMVWFLRKLFPIDLTYYRDFLVALNEALARDARFGPARWFRWERGVTFGEPSSDPLAVI